MARTFNGKRPVSQMSEALICAFSNMGAPEEMDLIIVLDDGPDGEKLAKCLLQVAEKYSYTGLRVALEELPAMERHAAKSM
jgi:hypothetical protein